MQQKVLISGASIAGLTLAYWLHRYGYHVTVIEISKGIRRGGSPIDVRGDALRSSEKMGILKKIKAKEFVHTDVIVNAQNKTLVTFSINDQTQYQGDIEIHRDDLVDILFANIPPGKVQFLFENRIQHIVQLDNHVKVTFKYGESRNFDFVFGADGTHSTVRKLVFGEEENYSKFFGAYFAFAQAPNLKSDKPRSGATMYQEIGKLAALYPFKNAVNAFLCFRSPKLIYDYRDLDQHKQILADNFRSSSWRIPEILDALLDADNLYFDEVCQIHMPTWAKGRVALVGDAAYTAGFPTGMGTSLAIQGATILAETLYLEKDHQIGFPKYDEIFRPFVESVQARITQGLNWSVPQTAEAILEATKRFK